jgi:hypothetical protein
VRLVATVFKALNKNVKLIVMLANKEWKSVMFVLTNIKLMIYKLDVLNVNLVFIVQMEKHYNVKKEVSVQQAQLLCRSVQLVNLVGSVGNPVKHAPLAFPVKME